jgi:hypothetical protein
VAPSYPQPDDHFVPTRSTGQGAAGQTDAPQPAAHARKLLVQGQATDAKAAEKQAETDSVALVDALENVGKHAPPAQISKAKHSVDIAQEKAETLHDA